MEDKRERRDERGRRTPNEPANHVTTGRGWQATFRMLRTPQAAAYRTPSRYPSQRNNRADCICDIKNCIKELRIETAYRVDVTSKKINHCCLLRAIGSQRSCRITWFHPSRDTRTKSSERCFLARSSAKLSQFRYVSSSESDLLHKILVNQVFLLRVVENTR